jgi:hypothetical protein
MRDAHDHFWVAWSELSPEELVRELNEGHLTWDMDGKRLCRDGEMVAKTWTPYYGDVLDELISEKAFFLPANGDNQ